VRVVYVDTETGGLSPEKHPIIQLAAIATEGDRILETFERKLSFDLEAADAEALRHNHFDLEVWQREAIDPREAAFQFSAFLRNHRSVEMVSRRTGKAYLVAQLAGHNAAFDRGFLDALFQRFEMFRPWSPHVLDTMQLAAWWCVGEGVMADLYALDGKPKIAPESLKLAALCRRFGVDLPEAHDAMADAEASFRLARVLNDAAHARAGLAAIGVC
jgi:DNA polymerase III epsilon subunit-like protein